MRKSIAENLIKSMSALFAIVIAVVMLLCASANASAKDLGNNLVIEKADSFLSDVSITADTDTSLLQLIASGANVELVESSTDGSVTSDGKAKLYVKIDAVSWWTCGTNYNQNFAYFFNDSTSTNAWSSCAFVYNSTSKIVYFTIPEGTWKNVILTRNSVTSGPTFDNKYNQTGDIVLQSDKNYISSFRENSDTVTWGNNIVPTPTTYSITPSSTEIKAGESVTFSPSINYTTYNVIKSNAFSVSGGSASDYSINNSDKTITFNKAGTYSVTDVITYNAIGYSSITGTVTTSAVSITVNPAQPDVAESVSLTSGTAFKDKPLKLTAKLTSKHDSGAVTYTFSKTSGSSGSFTTSEVTTTDDEVTVVFTPSATGNYTFKVEVSEDNHNSIETTLTVSVKTNSWYIYGQWVAGWATTSKKADMLYDDDTGYFYYSKQAQLNGNDDPSIYFRLIADSTQKGGSSTSNDTLVPLTKDTLALANNNSKALKISDLTASQIVTVYTDGTYVWYSKTEGVDHDITVDSGITHGTVTADKDTAKQGDEVTLTVTPATGYEIDTLKYNTTDIDTSTNKFTMPDSDVTIYATFKTTTYNIRYFVGGTEDTSLTPKTYTVETNTFSLPSVSSRTGYTFSGWHLGSSTGALTTQITKGSTGDKSFYGTYNANTYTITFDPNGGSVSTTTKTVTYNSTYGTLPTPTKTNCTFQGWYLGDTKITSSSTVTITSNSTLVARYADNPTITVTIIYGGVEDSSKATVTGDGRVAYNGSSTVTITPASGYYISSLTGTGSAYEIAGGAWSKQFTSITTDINITATITDNPTVTINVYYGGSIVTNKATVTGDGQVSSYGASQSVSVTPNSGYYISSISATGASVSYTAQAGAWTSSFTVKTNIVLSVYISDNPKVKVKYVDLRSNEEITSGAVAVTIAGSANNANGVSVAYNSSPQLSASIVTPNSYVFAGYFASNGTISLSASNPYSLPSVTTDTEVVAKFDKLYRVIINWEHLNGLKIGTTTLTTAQVNAGTYSVYKTQGSSFEIVTTLADDSEYKLNKDCFVYADLTNGEYNTSYSSNYNEKHFDCTVANKNGSLTITPVAATYSGSGYWGQNELTFNLDGFKDSHPYYTITFSATGKNDKTIRLVCTETDKTFVCVQPTGYTKFVLHRINPSSGAVWNNSGTITIGTKYEYTAKEFSGGTMNLQ